MLTSTLAISYLTAVLLGCTLVVVTLGCLGVFVVANRRALDTDMIAHGALPGAVAGWFTMTTFGMAGWLVPAMVLGGVLSAIGGGILRRALVARKVTSDSATVLVAMLSFALSLLALSIVQQYGYSNISSAEHLLFGQAAALQPADLSSIATVCLSALAVVLLLQRRITAALFDPQAGQSWRAQWYTALLYALLCVVTVVSMEVVGALLVVGAVALPALIARVLVASIHRQLLVAPLAGTVGALLGIGISQLFSHSPTGPWILLVLAGLFLAAALFSPQYGVLAMRRKRRAFELLVAEDHIVKQLRQRALSRAELMAGNRTTSTALHEALQQLLRQRVVESFSDGTSERLQLTEAGLAHAGALIRRHRLWESYLAEKVGTAQDHVHQNAEAIEHLIDDQLEQKLRQELGNPSRDPHGQEIAPAEKSTESKQPRRDR